VDFGQDALFKIRLFHVFQIFPIVSLTLKKEKLKCMINDNDSDFWNVVFRLKLQKYEFDMIISDLEYPKGVIIYMVGANTNNNKLINYSYKIH
jgi:hypothetical protein